MVLIAPGVWRFETHLLPPPGSGQNTHADFHVQARANERYRKAVYGWLDRLPPGERPPKGQPIDRCSVDVRAYYCRRQPRVPNPEVLAYKGARRATDIQNLAGDTKALIDAFTPYRTTPVRTVGGKVTGGAILWGAGIISSDRFEHVTAFTLGFAPAVALFAEERIVITITDLDVERVPMSCGVTCWREGCRSRCSHAHGHTAGRHECGLHSEPY